MEKAIKQVREEIVGSASETEKETSVLTQCALDIAEVAIKALNGDLREKALNIAKAIADYEDALKPSA